MRELPDGQQMLARVREHRPRLRSAGTGWQAATALILAGHAPSSLLVIRRTTRPGDRWSGDAALPGGKREPQDADLVTTARRETREEVGIDLPADPIGRLDDVGGRAHRGTVSPFVFHVPEERATVLQAAEVDAASWVPLRILIDPAHATRTPTRAGPFAAWTWGDLVIWGLTRGVLLNFLAIVGTEG